MYIATENGERCSQTDLTLPHGSKSDTLPLTHGKLRQLQWHSWAEVTDLGLCFHPVGLIEGRLGSAAAELQRECSASFVVLQLAVPHVQILGLTEIKGCLQPRSANDEPPARDVKVAVSRHCTRSEPGMRLRKAELKRKSWGSASTRSGSSEDDLEEQPPSCKESVLCAIFLRHLSPLPPSAAVRFGERARNQQPSLPHAALVGIATGNDEHCSQSFRCDLTLPM